MKTANITTRPYAHQFASFRDWTKPRFLITVDTEEEFDWNAPADRTSHTTSSVHRLQEFQTFCETRNIAPLYFIDYPIATSPEAIAILQPAAAQGRAEIGLHLHPWVNPPFEEELCPRNTYAGNLTIELERAKLLELQATVQANFGIIPRIYRAGRYGAGPNTSALLAEAGIAFDSSVRTNFNYNYDGGPNYNGHTLHPYWINEQRSLLELPVTTLFCGPLRNLGPKIHPAVYRTPIIRSILSRLRLLSRVPLTPEGVKPAEAIRAINTAISINLPLMVFSFHSPSLEPGHTAYVKTEQDRQKFYDWWDEILAHLSAKEISPTTLSQISDNLALAQSENAI